MAIGLATALILSGVLGAMGTTANMAYNAIEAGKNRQFQAEQAQIDRDFQEQMRNTSITSQVDQAKELGISPSLVLGQGSNSLGGAMASGSQASNQTNSMANTANQLMNYIKQDRYLDTMEQMQDKKFDALENFQKMKSSTTGRDFTQRNYTPKEIDKLFDDIDKIEF